MRKGFWDGKKVLVTGHTGFKGSWLVLWLNMLGAKVYGYARPPNTSPSLFSLLGLETRMGDSKFADIRDLASLSLFLDQIGPEIIIHMAAQPLVRYSYMNPVETYQTNVMGPVNLFEAIRKVDSVRVVINVTTDKCYENKKWIWGYRENEPLGGYDPYSSSKACSEIVTSAYRNSFFNLDKIDEHGVSIASARAGNVIGGGDWAHDRLVPDVIRSFCQNQVVKIRNPDSIRPWQHVLEPLSGYLRLAEKMWEDPVEYASAWNFGPLLDGEKQVSYLVNYLSENWYSEARWEVARGDHLHEDSYLKLDISKAITCLNWVPVWSLDQALDRIIEWYRTWDSNDDIFEFTLSQIKSYEASM